MMNLNMKGAEKKKMKKQTNAIYTYCECCNNLTAIYDWEDKRFICTECGYIDELSPQQERCPECNNLYISFTWFDPCVCPHCGTGLNDPEADYLIPVLEKETEENNES